ncbi:WD repeat-containing protein 43-like isoform X2 [Glycine soja]|uniref:WD repeat-containing protein 43 isoform A n=1 Tax=Glycine soja TaxID=3848 RepID=A0A445JHS5_GLYSO|nr:WD repeat-containing protein 43-like isoform X2 [Glycine soja]RZB98009.1 WD repeat-containing protein 43 isoform A [Glycine soja]
MVKDKLKKHVLTAFTPNGDYVAILSANEVAKIWNTNTGHLLAEWKPSDGDHDIRYSCIACSFIGKKRRKEQGTCLLALGTIDGSVLAVDVSTGERKLTTSHPGGICGLSFANKGRLLRIVGHNGVAYGVNTETGELLKEFKITKKSITSLAFSNDEKYLAIVSSRPRVISWEIGEEILKFPNDLGNVEHISISSDAKNLVTSDFEGKHLQVWKCDLNSGNLCRGPTLPIRHPPLVLDCHSGCNKEDVVVLAVTGRGSAYVWNLSASSKDQIQPTKLTTETKIVETDKENGVSSKKRHTLIIASRLQPVEENKQMKALVTYGSVDHPQFSILNISNSGENIVLYVGDETDSVQQHDSPSGKAIPMEIKKAKKRQATSDPDLPTTTNEVDLDQHEAAEGVLLDDDLNEPTMGEKLASLSVLDGNKSRSDTEQESSVPAKPPSADSVHVLLKQALNADDRTLLLDCLFTQDEKVIRKSIAQLNPSNVLKLLYSLISIIESRGSILVCALPWLKCLLLQHASGIMSQESSLKALNSLYQLIESRVSTFKSAIQLSSCLDTLRIGWLLLEQAIDEEEDEGEMVPVIYEDKDTDDDEESDDAMEDNTDEQQPEEQFHAARYIDANEDM